MASHEIGESEYEYSETSENEPCDAEVSPMTSRLGNALSSISQFRFPHVTFEKLSKFPSLQQLPKEILLKLPEVNVSWDNFYRKLKNIKSSRDIRSEDDLPPPWEFQSWIDASGVKNSVNIIGNIVKHVTPRSGVLFKFEDLPAFLQDNNYIHEGYRCFYSTSMCLKSIFQLHNETINIWTHLLGFILFNVLMWLTFCYYFDDYSSRCVFAVFLLSAQKCMLASTCFHTLGCKSSGVFRRCSGLDYMGVATLIGGSIFVVVYYLFYCSPNLQLFYLCCLGVVSLAIMLLPMWGKFHLPRVAPARALLFVAFGCSGVVPLIHYFCVNEIHWPILEALLWFLLMGGLYLIGVYIYVKRFPENLLPGKFDIWGSSHQIWHVCIVLAALAHLKGCIQLYSVSINSCPVSALL